MNNPADRDALARLILGVFLHPTEHPATLLDNALRSAETLAELLGDHADWSLSPHSLDDVMPEHVRAVARLIQQQTAIARAVLDCAVVTIPAATSEVSE
jgi:hypothetical protein